MIVVGIAPGLKSTSYSVLDVSGGTAVDVDKDVLTGGRFKAGLVDLGRKAWVHYLILSVVFERDPPALIAIGPPCNPKDPPEHIAAFRRVLQSQPLVQQIPFVRVVTTDEIQKTLSPGPHESMTRAAGRRLSRPLDCDDRRIVLAVTIALTGASLHQGVQS